MDIANALQIVIDLAKNNALNPGSCPLELVPEAERQKEAISIVEDMAVNQFGDN